MALQPPPDDGSSVSSVASSRGGSGSGPSSITVPSTGPEFFEYRRACFLAGAPLPVVSSSSPASLPNSGAASTSAVPPPRASYNPPPTYTLPPPPAPAPSVPYAPSSSSAVGRLEALLANFNTPSDDMHDPAAVAWHGGVSSVHRSLTGSKRLSKGLRLGLVIRILRAGWIKDGTWPCEDGVPVDPPSSPELGPVKEIRYPPPHENRRPRKVDESTIRGPQRPVVHDAVSSAICLSPPKEKSTLGSRLAALTSSFLNGSSSGSPASGSGWSIGPSSAVLVGTD
ncbi:hypothetical protein CC85DRAFT_329495 [Cutaneotrichosporon oleaginosum]|uniref:DUF4050 domain-containing protein n=1 Tax=Cutaneotrichosporon oleaginosum TaxID=879819 RepID=A0A0J1B019_9TREE|nr:uncharacterized protein CC85DRAFT_329495 [Cutaneotrichosporon oleaginosum]KLT40934.1 hypothetical protein CC85DRAFT_329495 [Cutaneotrichosporon oleaginosum]TXT15427.1 hypothetical protein COLE_01620 [Cutaneotrichosporon oleaginosum]